MKIWKNFKNYETSACMLRTFLCVSNVLQLLVNFLLMKRAVAWFSIFGTFCRYALNLRNVNCSVMWLTFNRFTKHFFTG